MTLGQLKALIFIHERTYRLHLAIEHALLAYTSKPVDNTIDSAPDALIKMGLATKDEDIRPECVEYSVTPAGADLIQAIREFSIPHVDTTLPKWHVKVEGHDGLQVRHICMLIHASCREIAELEARNNVKNWLGPVSIEYTKPA